MCTLEVYGHDHRDHLGLYFIIWISYDRYLFMDMEGILFV